MSQQIVVTEGKESASPKRGSRDRENDVTETLVTATSSATARDIEVAETTCDAFAFYVI